MKMMFGRLPAVAFVTLAGVVLVVADPVDDGVATATLPLAVVGATDPTADVLPEADGTGAVVPEATGNRLHASSAVSAVTVAPSLRKVRRPTVCRIGGRYRSFIVITSLSRVTIFKGSELCMIFVRPLARTYNTRQRSVSFHS